MEIGNTTVGAVSSGLGVYLTIIAGIYIGAASASSNPAVLVMAGVGTGVMGFWYWMWGLRRAGKVGDNKWLPRSW